MQNFRYYVRAFAIKVQQVVDKKTAKVFGWQLIFNEEYEGEGFRQFHYLGMKLTSRQARLLVRSPFISLENLTGGSSEYQYVVATKLALENHNGKKTKLKVARKEWEGEESLQPYLRN